MRYAVLATCVLLSGVRAEEKTFDSGGVKIAYLDEGKGEVVVLLHGFGGSVPETWTHSPFAEAQFLPALKGYRVLAIDHRGHGKSGQPHDPSKYGREMAEDVVRLLDHEKVKKAHVVGYSMGSFVAGKVLVSHPDRLLSVTFGGGGPLFQPPKKFTDTVEATAASLENGKGIGPLLLALTEESGQKVAPEQADAFSAGFIGGKDQKALAVTDFLKANKE
jgi:pimeloyl-ACP methyl ester carboxylesterase